MVEFSWSGNERAVLSTWGNAELLQSQGFGQAFLNEALVSQVRSLLVKSARQLTGERG